MSSLEADITIVGAGAAGLAAAIFAAEANPRLRIMLLDGAKTIGAKILVSGGGRCNVTNKNVRPADFHAPRHLVQRVLKRFDERQTVTWFESLGITLKEEPQGKLFPESNSAKPILQALIRRCQELGIFVLADHRVEKIDRTEGCFKVSHIHGSVRSRTVIIATGGRSLPRSGSDGQGWEMVQALGHTVSPTYQALVPLVLKNTCFHAELSGISHEVELTTWIEGRVVDRRRGSLLWTHFGISGPVVLDASRFWVMAQGQGKSTAITLSFLPDETFESLDARLVALERALGNRSLESILTEHLPVRVVKVLCGVGEGQEEAKSKELEEKERQGVGRIPIRQLSRSARRGLAKRLTEFPVPILRARGWNYAEVTAGGVPLEEVKMATMESRIVPGLHLVGEMLDCDGRIGGFNFQWAWSTGFIAGKHAAK